MTLFEVILAMLMLVVFTGVVAVVNEFTVRFFTNSEQQYEGDAQRSNGVVIEHRQIQLAMDELTRVLAQPGISKEYLDNKVALNLENIRIDGDARIDFEADCVGSDPVSAWRLPIPPVKIPPGYKICLWKTSIVEQRVNSRLSKPGLYILQALPEAFGPSKLPVRRLFCRPRPFC